MTSNKSEIMKIQKLLYEIDCIKYQNKQCYYISCLNSPISSHTISENYLYKLGSDLKDILTFESATVGIFNSPTPTNMKPVTKDKFSTFDGFCEQHDCALFKSIDEYDGTITSEKAALVHYRNICYGVNHIQTQKLRLTHLSKQHFVETEPASKEIHTIIKKIKNGSLVKRLNYCLDEHLKRKTQLEHIIQTHSFDKIEYQVLYGGKDDPICSGRSTCLLHKDNSFFNTQGYCIMPWITYMTLLTNQKNDLVFCWLRSDKLYTKGLNSLLKRGEFKNTIGTLAYACSDSFAVKREIYEKNSSAIAIFSSFRVY